MRKIFLLLLSLVSFFTKAQQATNTIQPTNLTNIPPSPEAANLGRYGSTPIGYYNGGVQLVIPLAELTDGPLRVPVTLSYNSTGNRVEEIASWVGLGWTLNAGGVITRSARGWADDAPSSNNSLSFLDLIRQHTWTDLTDGRNANSATYYDKLARGCWDAEPDIFSFNFNGHTGQFAFDWTGQLTVQSDSKIKVEPTYDSQRTIISWRVITENGAIYTFSSQEITTDRRPQSFACRSGYNTFISAWYLSSISDVNEEHRIDFSYDSYAISYGARAPEARYYGTGGTVNCPLGLTGQEAGSIDPFTYSSLRLQRITASHGQTQLTFSAGSLRADTQGLTGSYNSNLRSLAKISVLDAHSTEVKAQEFTYDPAYSTGRLTLQSICQTGKGGVKLPPHQFVYSGTLPDNVLSKAQDHWGFFNGASNSTLLPTYALSFGGINNTIYPGGDRAVHPEYAQAGVLTRVSYPTGGYTEFTYESNDYSYIGGAFLGERQEYLMQDIVVGVGAGPYSDPPVAYQSCDARTRTFTIEPLPNTPNHVSRPVRITWQAHNSGTVGDKRPYVAILRADGSEVYAPGAVGAGNYMEQPIIENIVLVPGTYTIKAFACNTSQNYPYDPANGEYGPPFATIDVAFQNANTNAPILKKLMGGIRIKEIREYAKTNSSVYAKKTFSYLWQNNNSISSGAIHSEPNYEFRGYYMYKPDGFTEFDRCDYMLYMARSAALLGTTQGGFVGYREVTVTSDGPTANGKTVYRYTSPYDYADTQGSTHVPLTPNYSRSHMTGLLTEQIEYASLTSGYVPIRKVTNEYTNYSGDIQGLMVLYPSQNASSYDSNAGNYISHQYSTGLGHVQLRHTQQTLYETVTGNAATTDSYFDYDTQGVQLSTERQIISPMKTKFVNHYYLNKYTSISTELANAVSRNAFPEIETVTSIEEGGNKYVLNSNYQDWTFQNGKIRLKAQRKLITQSPISQANYRVSALDVTARPDDRLQQTVVIDSYDAKGNVQQLHREKGDPVARIWGYGQHLLIAEVQNAPYNRIAATSFEPGSTGGWTYDLLTSNRVGGQTGDWSYELNGANDIVLTSPLPNGEYTLTMWATDEPIVFNNTTPVALTKRVVGTMNSKGFRLYRYEFQLTATTSGLRLSTANSARVDELRLHPVGAHMVSMTFDPTMGKTSQTDANNRTLFYEYDAFGRLQHVRDEQGRILSENEYHYANP